MEQENRNRKMSGGYLTVTVAITLLLVISLCFALIEGTRKNTMMLEAACAVDTGMNSILAEFHRELLRQYDLFFIDTSYGTISPDYNQTLEHLQEYVSANLGEKEFLEYIGRDLIDLHWKSGKVIGLSVASDNGGEVLRRQIVDYMEDKVGISFMREILDRVELVEEYSLTGDWFTDMESDAKQKLSEWKNGATIQDEEKTPAMGTLDEMMADLQEGVLKLMVGLENVSNEAIDCADFLSHRELLQGTGVDENFEYTANAWEQFIVNEYVLEKTGCYVDEKEGSGLRYQTEYILYGMGSDLENIIKTVEQILLIREAANALHIMGDSEKVDLVTTVSDFLASAVGAPEISPVLQVLLVVTWAGFEGLWDIEQLLNGEKIALIKSDGEWHYGLSLFSGITEEKQLGNVNEGLDAKLDYKDYLRILLLLQDKQTTTFRLMDIMEMDIRLTEGNAHFRMDGCIDSIKVQIDLESGYGYDFSLTRSYGY